VFRRRKRTEPSAGITLKPWTGDPGVERIASIQVERPDGRAVLDFAWRADTDDALNDLRNEIFSWPDE